MVVFVGAPPFMRIVLWVAMETMHLDIARISFFLETKILEHDWGSNEQFNTHGNLSWGSKVGQIRSYGTSNMILIACFQRFFVIFVFFSPPKKYHFPSDFLRTFFYKTGHLSDTKTVDNISQGISCGSRVIFG